MSSTTARLRDGRTVRIEQADDGRYYWTAAGPGWSETSSAATLCAAFEAATAALAYREREQAA